MGEGPIEERGWVLRDLGHGRTLGPSPPPGSPLRLPLNCLVPAECPCSVPTLATLLRWCLYLPPTRAQMGQARGPARILLGLKSGSRWISPGRTSLLCDLGQQHPLPVTRGLVHDPRRPTPGPMPSWVGKCPESEVCGVPGVCARPVGAGGWLMASCGCCRQSTGGSTHREDSHGGVGLEASGQSAAPGPAGLQAVPAGPALRPRPGLPQSAVWAAALGLVNKCPLLPGCVPGVCG